MADLTSLYDQLREADRLAQQGDRQAQEDAQKIYNHIQSLQVGKKETEEKIEEMPFVTGLGGAGAGALLQFGSKIGPTARFLKNLPQTQRDLNTLSEAVRTGQIGQPATQKPPIPTTVGQFHAPQMVSEYGFGPGAMKNIEHNVSQKMGNPLHASLAERPIPGFQLEGNRMVITPTNMVGTPPTTSPITPTQPSGMFASAVDRAKQMGSTINRLPGAGAARFAGPIAGGFGAGFGGAETYNRLVNENDLVGGGLSAIETAGGLASMYPPLAPIGLPVSYGAMMLNMLRDKYGKKPEVKSVMEKAEGGLVGGLSSLPQPSALTAQLAQQQQAPQYGLPPVHNLDMLSAPNSSGSRPFNDMYNPNMRYAPPFKEGGSTTPAWQRKEGKSPSGGLNAVGRASYKRETGGTLKAPQPEGGSRKKSFCARMGGMKKKLTSAKTANDPDSRINKALRKWKC